MLNHWLFKHAWASFILYCFILYNVLSYNCSNSLRFQVIWITNLRLPNLHFKICEVSFLWCITWMYYIQIVKKRPEYFELLCILFFFIFICYYQIIRKCVASWHLFTLILYVLWKDGKQCFSNLFDNKILHICYGYNKRIHRITLSICWMFRQYDGISIEFVVYCWSEYRNVVYWN